MCFPSPPFGRWWKTLPTIFLWIWLIRPRTHAEYFRTIYPNITGGFNYSKRLAASSVKKNNCPRAGSHYQIVEVNTIYIWLYIQSQRVTADIQTFLRRRRLILQLFRQMSSRIKYLDYLTYLLSILCKIQQTTLCHTHNVVRST